MIRRVYQFYRAVTSRMEEEDRAFVDGYLSSEEQILFYAMHRVDQCHALGVARTAKDLAAQSERPVDVRLLLRASLLHDVGRRQGDLDLFGKVAAVLLTSLFPRRSRAWAAGGCHILSVYYLHPWIGARLLLHIGLRREAALVRRHHAPLAPGDSRELQLLRAADERN